MSTNVRIDSGTHEELKRLARIRSQSQGEVVQDALESLKKEMFFEEMARSYDRLTEEDDTWSAYRREVDKLDGTLADGLPSSSAEDQGAESEE